MAEFTAGDRVMFQEKEYIYQGPAKDPYNTSIPLAALKGLDDELVLVHAEDVDQPALEDTHDVQNAVLRRVIDHDIERVLPQWLQGSVASVLEDQFGLDSDHRDVNILDLASTLRFRMENQFHPELMDQLENLARTYGPAGIALAAASLTPWPALYERLHGPEAAPELPELTEKPPWSWLHELRYHLSAPQDATWETMMVAVVRCRAAAEQYWDLQRRLAPPEAVEGTLRLLGDHPYASEFVRRLLERFEIFIRVQEGSDG
jgi:hypothetical protein